jgi:chaperonin cofactor prefoldin
MAAEAECAVNGQDAQEMQGCLEVRIETLKRRIAELENENEFLRSQLRSESGTVSHLFSARPNSY